MGELGIKPANRAVVQPALDKEAASGEPACAIELKDGTIVTGRDTKLMSAPASTILNALKSLAKLPDRLKLIAPQIVKPIMDLKQQFCMRKTTNSRSTKCLSRCRSAPQPTRRRLCASIA